MELFALIGVFFVIILSVIGAAVFIFTAMGIGSMFVMAAEYMHNHYKSKITEWAEAKYGKE